MPDTSVLIPLVSAGTAGVFCILFILGFIFPRSVVTDLKSEIAELKEALEAQRDRADTAVAAQKSTVDVMAALQAGLTLGFEKRSRPEVGDQS